MFHNKSYDSQPHPPLKQTYVDRLLKTDIQNYLKKISLSY